MTQEIIFTPVDAANLAIEAVNEIKETQFIGIRTGIKILDKNLLPLRPSELLCVLGYTSWYKSGFMNWLLRAGIEQCGDDDICVKVTWEDSVEEDTLKWIAARSGIPISTIMRGEIDDWQPVYQSYSKRIGTPLWLVGHSTQRNARDSRARPRMTMNDVTEALKFIQTEATDNQYKIRLIVLDYLQRIRPDPQDGQSKREQMMEAVNKAKDMAITFGCPVVLGVQASRAVLDRDFKLPRLDDGLETSNIEQSSDKVISLWYPIKTEKEGLVLEPDPGKKMSVTKNLLLLGIQKQKMGLAPVKIPLWVNPEQNYLTAWYQEER